MPTYEYECPACKKTFERFEKILARPNNKCPHCGKRRAKRLILGGSGLIFKGSGFYCTDYRNEPSKKEGAPEKKSDDGKPEKSD